MAEEEVSNRAILGSYQNKTNQMLGSATSFLQAVMLLGSPSIRSLVP